MAADDVAAAVVDAALGAPVNGMVEVAGPERIPLDDIVRRYLRAKKDPRQVIADVNARYFGIEMNDRTLTPDGNPRLGPTHFEDWLSRSVAQA